jgi:hypothetical protein
MSKVIEVVQDQDLARTGAGRRPPFAFVWLILHPSAFILLFLFLFTCP